jgi:hypothetical protein
LNAIAGNEEVGVWAHRAGPNVDELSGKNDLSNCWRLGLLSKASGDTKGQSGEGD